MLPGKKFNKILSKSQRFSASSPLCLIFTSILPFVADDDLNLCEIYVQTYISDGKIL